MQKIPYGRQYITDDDINAVIEVLKSDYLTQGPRITEFEKEIAEYHGAKYGVAFSNGTAALHGAYSSLGVSDGDEIITSPITFAATANAAIYCGAKPCFVDIDEDTNCIDVNKIEDAITEKTKVISPVAFGGYPVDLRSIHEITEKKGIKVLYDAAHAIASKRDGTFGMEYVDAAILSFHPVKHIATGEGGMVLTNDEDIYKKLLLFRSHGITKDPELLERNDGPWYYEMQSLGFNYRITDMQCALGISQFKRIASNIKRRNEIAKIYNDELSEVSGLIVPPNVGFEMLDSDDLKGARDIHSYHLYTLQTKSSNKRKQLYENLHEKGILAQIHYIPVHMQPYYQRTYGYHKGDYPIAEAFYEREVSIPMFHSLQNDALEYIISEIKKFNF